MNHPPDDSDPEQPPPPPMPPRMSPPIDDLDEDPEIDDDELAGEAEDHLQVDDGALDDADRGAPERAVHQHPWQWRRLLGRSDETTVAEDEVAVEAPPAPAESTEAPAKRIDELGGTGDPPAPPPRRTGMRTLHIGAPPVGPADELVDDAADDDLPEVHDAGTISGHVSSTRGRGLSGIAVVAIGADGEVAGRSTTGRRGQFVVEDLSAGSYRVGAQDTVDGDFADGWYGGGDLTEATELHLDDQHTVHDIELTVIGRVAIDAAVDVRRTKVVVDIEIIDRATGMPGEGTVVVSTEHFRAELPLTTGRSHVTLLGLSRDGDSGLDGISTRLRVEYLGHRHSAAATRTIRLR